MTVADPGVGRGVVAVDAAPTRPDPKISRLIPGNDPHLIPTQAVRILGIMAKRGKDPCLWIIAVQSAPIGADPQDALWILIQG